MLQVMWCISKSDIIQCVFMLKQKGNFANGTEFKRKGAQAWFLESSMILVEKAKGQGGTYRGRNVCKSTLKMIVRLLVVSSYPNKTRNHP